jgi:hypothetical protein
MDIEFGDHALFDNFGFSELVCQLDTLLLARPARDGEFADYGRAALYGAFLTVAMAAEGQAGLRGQSVHDPGVIPY